MAMDIDELFRRGDRPLIEFLQFCVYTRRVEPLFAFLVGEYRQNPTAPRAEALYDLFVATKAPARLAATDLLPPENLRIDMGMRRLRAHPGSGTAGPFLPSRDLFDFIVDELHRDSEQGPLAEAARSFDPERTGLENLPEETVPDDHRGFVEGLWRPVIRRRLTAAGFWRIATIGG
jgi:hypothetical protein